MDPISIADFVRQAFDRVDVVVASEANGSPEVSWGDTFFFFGEERHYPMPFATIVTKDYPDHDTASALDRPGVFRLNIGLRPEKYATLFPATPAIHDFTALDRLMPHPVYAQQSWVCILNPSDVSFAALHSLLQDAYTLAMERSKKLST